MQKPNLTSQLEASRRELEGQNFRPKADTTPLQPPSPHELKGLETQLAKAKADLAIAKEEARVVVEKEFAAQKRVQDLEKRIQYIKSQSVDPIISEHAILRYLQHVKGINIDEIKDEMMDTRTKEAIKFARSGKLKKGNITLVFQNNTIVTVVEGK